MLTLLAIFTLAAPYYLVVNPPHLVCDSIDSDCSDLVHLEGDVIQTFPPEPRNVLCPLVPRETLSLGAEMLQNDWRN